MNLTSKKAAFNVQSNASYCASDVDFGVDVHVNVKVEINIERTVNGSGMQL